MSFAITSTAMEAVLAHARAEHPHEACGLLIGTRGATPGTGTVTEARVARNVAPHPERGFEIDPATLLTTHREARGSGHIVVGHYHSHPSGSTEPSRTDAARAVEDGQLWLIVADGKVGGWLAASTGDVHGRFTAVALNA